MLWLKIKNDFHTVITVLSSLPYLSFWKASENSGESPVLDRFLHYGHIAGD